MANRQRGEVRLEVNGQTHILRLTMNAMCSVEGALKEAGREMSFPEFAARLKYSFMTDVRLFIWAAMLDHQPSITVEQAGAFITDGGGPMDFAERIRTLLGTAEPEPEDLRALHGGSPPDPRLAVPGTGVISRFRRGVLALAVRTFGVSPSVNSSVLS